MSLLLSISINQIVTSSNRAGSISLFSWSRFETADARLLFDVACDRVLGRLKLKNLNENCQRFEPRSHFKSRLSLIVLVNVVLNRNVVVDSD